MKKSLGVVAGLVGAVLLASGAAAAEIELRVSTGPAVELLIGQDVGWNWQLALSVGLHFGTATQTPSARIQTPSLMIAAHVRYAPLGTQQPTSPYLGVSAVARITRDGLSASLRPHAGIRVRLFPHVYLLAEGGISIPIVGAEERRWDFAVGVSARF